MEMEMEMEMDGDGDVDWVLAHEWLTAVWASVGVIDFPFTLTEWRRNPKIEVPAFHPFYKYKKGTQ